MKIRPAEYWTLLRQDAYAFTERVFCQLHPGQPFLPNWHLELLVSELEACRVGTTRRLILNLPPRSLKSVVVSVGYVAYWLGHHPSARIICASYGQDLSDKHARDCRAVMEADWYRRAFRTRLARKQSAAEFETTGQGSRLATSVSGGLTGRGADVLILDDILKPEEALSETQRRKTNDWYSHSLYSRLNDKEAGTIIIVQQRLHEDDLVGHVLQQEGWRLVRLPAIADADEAHRIVTPYGTRIHTRGKGEALHPGRESVPGLERIRRTVGEYNFAGQYQQAPAPLGGGLIKREWFRTYEPHGLPEQFDAVVQSWDTANKAGELANYSVCTTWGRRGKDLYLLEVYRERLDFPTLVRAAQAQQAKFKADLVLVEEAASGVQLVQQLASLGVHSVKAIKPEGDKVMRMHAQSPAIENGLVHLPRQAPWLDVYLHELTTFPASKHADQVDSTSQALAWFSAHKVDPALMQAHLEECLQAMEEQAAQRAQMFDEMNL